METLDLQARVLGGRFRALQLLKKGLGVDTFLGEDLNNPHQKVIIKTATKDASPSALLRLEHEADVLSQVKSQWLPPLLMLERDGNLIHLVTPFVPGITLENRLRNGPLNVRDTMTVARCILLALIEVHEKAVLHRDIKPGNIVLTDETPIKKATLIDFGFARSSRLDAKIRDLPVGTVRYMSPEQAGLIGDLVEEPADLYSVGLVLYECLVGKPLFEGATAGDVLRQILGVQVPELRELGISVPRALNDVIHRLLRKDPKDRYQSADAVLADLREIAEALDEGIEDPPLVVGLYDRRNSLTAPAFVGRKDEIAAFDQQLKKLKRGMGGVVLVEAESGGGKSRLLDEMAGRAAQSGFWVIRGQGVDQAAQRPLQALDGVVQELLELAKDQKFKGPFVQGMGDQSAAVVSVLPALKEVFGIESDQSLGQEEHAETRSLAALAALVDELGRSDKPCVVLLDDCQWIDELTLKMLSYWVSPARRHRKGRSNSKFTLVVALFRSDEIGPEHSLRQLKSNLHLKLAPFGPQDIRNLVESMAGALPKEAVDLVVDFAEGSPFFAAAVLQGLVEAGALVREKSDWIVRHDALAKVQSSRQAAVLLSKRLDLLSSQTLRLLSVGAVLGNRFDLQAAAKLAGQTPSEAIPAAQEARRKHIIWTDASGGRLFFVHDKLREAFLKKLSHEQRQDIHLRAAQHLEATDPERYYEISFHYGAADAYELALPYAIRAAKHARSQQALEIAEHHYRIAEKGLKDSDRRTRGQIVEALGDVLMLRGRYQEALPAFESARSMAEGKLAQAQVDAKIGELAFKRGDMKGAAEALERGLERLGFPVKKSLLGFVFSILWQVGIQTLHTLFPSRFVGQLPLEGAEISLLRVRLYSRLTYTYWFQSGAVPTLWSHLMELNLAELYPPTRELGQALSTHAPVMTMIPSFKRAMAYGKKSLEVRRTIGDLWGEAQALHFYGAALFGATRYSEAKEVFQESIRLLERTGDRWEVNGATYHLAFCFYRMGDLKRAIEYSRRAHEAGLLIGDSFASGASLNIWSKASGGEVPEAVIAEELKRPSEDKQRNAEVLQAEGIRRLGVGDYQNAVEFLKKSLSLVQKAGLRTEYVASIPIWLGHALRKQAESKSPWDPNTQTRLAKECFRMARKGLRLARFYKNNLPHALREYGLALALHRNHDGAIRMLTQSIELARSQGARFEEAQSLLARAQLNAVFGSDSTADFHDAQHLFQSPEMALSDSLRETLNLPGSGVSGGATTSSHKVTLSILDRFDKIVDVGRQITAALNREAIHEKIKHAALTLLRGEHCLILDVPKSIDGQSGEIAVVEGDKRVRFSRELVARALSEGHATVMGQDFSSDASESALLSGARSALCVPIFIRGVAARCLYVTHSEVGELFGEEEEKLAGFIAALAGTALDHAEAYLEIQTLSQSLEKDVSERKATEVKLQASLKEKEVLLGEVYHRTKNNMQVISSLINLQTQYVTDPKVLEIFRESQNRIRTMALVHEKLYRSSDLVNIKFKEYIESLVSGLVYSYTAEGQVLKVGLDVDDIQIGIDSAIPCGLIINELVSNALKYAFPKNHAANSRIDLSLKKDNNRIQLIVKDNGVGMREDFDLNQTHSLGLRLVTGLVEKQLRGKMTFKREQGTEFSISFEDQS